MFDIGWSEMAIIALLALIIIGPKDLPRVARTVGQWVRKGRMLAREFQTSLEDMAKEADLDDVKKEIEKVGKTDLKKAVENTIDPKGELAKAFDTSDSAADKPEANKDAGVKALNGSAEAKAGGESQTSAKAPGKPAPKSAATAPKASAAKKKPVAAAKKPATAAKKPATPRAARTTKKAAAPRKRAAKPASSAQSGAKSGGGDPSPPADETGGGAAMAAKSS